MAGLAGGDSIDLVLMAGGSSSSLDNTISLAALLVVLTEVTEAASS